MAFEKGRKKTGGRKKGTPNKNTVAVKEALQQAFHELGSVEALVEFGRENPKDFYQMWAKSAPQEFTATEDSVLTIQWKS